MEKALPKPKSSNEDYDIYYRDFFCIMSSDGMCISGLAEHPSTVVKSEGSSQKRLSKEVT